MMPVNDSGGNFLGALTSLRFIARAGCEILRCCPGGPGGMSWMEMHRKWSSCSADGSTKDNSLVLAGELRCTVEEAEGGGLAVGVWWGHQHGIIRSYNGSGRLAEVARLQPTGSL